jgi:hypothetical protein
MVVELFTQIQAFSIQVAILEAQPLSKSSSHVADIE